MNPDKLRMEPAAVQFVRDFVQSGKPVASICHGPWNFVEADVARGRRLTSWPSVRTDLRNAGAEVVDEEVVTDGNITTSRSPDDLPAFCERIVQEFARRPAARRRGRSGMTSSIGNVASLAARAGGTRRPPGAVGHRPVRCPAGRRGPAGVRVARGDRVPRAVRRRHRGSCPRPWPSTATGSRSASARPPAARAPSWPPGCATGPSGSALSRLSGSDPQADLRSALRRAKQLIEVGEVLAVDPAPHGKRTATPGGVLLEAWTKVAPKAGVR